MPASTAPEDAQQLENADTVIRGSSRVGSAGENIDRLNRTPAAVAQVLLGKRLNHFFLDELIGGGGMGAVFRAHDEQLDREVAIKVIPFAGDDPDLQRRFRNEAQSAAKLDHPRIARVFDVGNQDDWYYIVFEYIRGTNIRDLVSSTDVLRIDDAVFYTCQVAEALQHASDRGIVHRDVKPSNVLIGDDRDVKLVDMGLARSEKMEMSQEDMTASGVTLGTFDYISPEQARDPRAADLRSDIYSLGCTLYYMLTGQPPYPGGTMLQKLLSHGNSPPPDARLLRSDVSYELAAVIQKMLAKDPDQRYQTANQLIAELKEIAFREGLDRSQGVGTVSLAATNPILIWFERNAPWLVAASLLLISVAYLQLTAAASRDEFALPRPRKVDRVMPNVDATPSVSTASRPTKQDEGNTPDPVESSEVPQMAPPSSKDLGAPADPPQVSLPVPDELEPPEQVEVVEMADADGEPLPATVAIGSSVIAEDGLDDSMSTVTEFPRLVRLVGPEAMLDPLGNLMQRDVDGAALATSLADALELSERYDIVDRIEIATPVVYSEPVTIRRDSIAIASTVGGTTIVFQTPTTLQGEQTQMLSLGSNRVDFEDIHFVWEVPDVPIERGSLIGMNANRLVRMIDCSVTIGNAAGREEIYAFDVVTDPAMTRSIGPALDDESLPLVAIRLYNVIVRGQITMMHMDYAAALQLQWENGLLAISRHMIETSGARVKPSLSTIQLSLIRLTSHAPLGLIRMTLDENGRFPVTIDREARSSVFMVNDGVPHVNVTGLESLTNEPPILKLRGEANAYEVDRLLFDTMLSLSDIRGRSETTQMTDLVSTAPDWWDERSTRWRVWWEQSEDDLSESVAPLSRDEIPADQLTPADYRQDGAVFSGFDEKSLPQLPFGGESGTLDTRVGGASEFERR
ncbi:MAG: serine/threonine protein kinase [Pirellulaceae bacterium]|nr:serine/threonine protein kinase [Pirellulaceae bacterium]